MTVYTALSQIQWTIDLAKFCNASIAPYLLAIEKRVIKWIKYSVTILIVQVVAFISLQAYKLQLTVDFHLSFLMELWTTGTQLKGQRHSITVMMVLLWRERWQQYAEQMGDGAPLQSAGKPQVTDKVSVWIKKLMKSWMLKHSLDIIITWTMSHLL